MMEMEAEKPTFSAFERFLYWFFIPIVFTMVLMGALFSLFGYSATDELLKIGNKVPGLSAILPDPKGEVKEAQAPAQGAAAHTEGTPEAVATEASAQLAALQKQLEAQTAELAGSTQALKDKEQTIKDLQAKVAALEAQKASAAKSDEEYQALITETASMYAKMSPSKAAPIMQNLTLKEQVLLLSEMKTDDRVRILEKMDAKKAAEASIYLKDAVPAKDKQIAALQERLDLNKTAATTTQSSAMTKQELGQTFANMTPKSAAELLVEMNKTDSNKVVEILNSMDVAGRSKIMTYLSDNFKEVAPVIASKLAP
jgi:flagellar motility protein MotE (MotC chaperone)